jgi:hypothetical protein
MATADIKRTRTHHPQRRCIFCGGTPVNSEHLFSEWISKIVPRVTQRHFREERKDSATQNIRTAGTYQSRRIEGDIASRKLKAPCRKCNSGWMSCLETLAKPVLTPLILGQETTLDLGAQRTLVDWVILKTIIGERDDEASARIPDSDIKQFYKHRAPPNGLKAWVGRYSRRTGAPGTRYSRFAIWRDDGIGVQISSFFIGELYIHVFTSSVPPRPNRDIYRLRERGAQLLAQIYPSTGSSIAWPLTHSMNDEDARFLVEAIVPPRLRRFPPPGAIVMFPLNGRTS